MNNRQDLRAGERRNVNEDWRRGLETGSLHEMCRHLTVGNRSAYSLLRVNWFPSRWDGRSLSAFNYPHVLILGLFLEFWTLFLVSHSHQVCWGEKMIKHNYKCHVSQASFLINYKRKLDFSASVHFSSLEQLIVSGLFSLGHWDTLIGILSIQCLTFQLKKMYYKNRLFFRQPHWHTIWRSVQWTSTLAQRGWRGLAVGKAELDVVTEGTEDRLPGRGAA